MAEHSIDIMGEFDSPQAILNGETETPLSLTETPQGARLDAARGVFITSRGNEIELSDKPVSIPIIQHLQTHGKPEIPLIEVTILGRKQVEPHPNHEGYLAQLAAWKEESEMRLALYIFNAGVKGQPSQDFIDEHQTYFPNATPQEMKYLWVSSLVPYEDFEALSQAIVGRAIPTPKGVEEVATSFRREG